MCVCVCVCVCVCAESTVLMPIFANIDLFRVNSTDTNDSLFLTLDKQTDNEQAITTCEQEETVASAPRDKH